MRTAALLNLCSLFSFLAGAAESGAASSAGLLARFESLQPGAAARDCTIRPAVALYVPEGEVATPFLAPGAFRVTWSGTVSTELRGEYRFRAEELRGGLKLWLNGALVLDATGSGSTTTNSTPVRLNKGTNSVLAIYETAAVGSASARLVWIPKGGAPEPIPQALLRHDPTDPELRDAERVHLGRHLFYEYRCSRCHAPPAAIPELSEASMTAPSLEAIGSRRTATWLAQWIQDPKALRPTARMPRLLQRSAPEDSLAAAAYLASLGETQSAPAVDGAEETSAAPLRIKRAEEREAGRKLFENLHCVACHDSLEETVADPARVSLKGVPEKFLPGALADYLVQPDAGYAWTRMPNFQFTQAEAQALASYLESSLDAPPARPAAISGTEVLERGKRLIQTSGCLNCHSLSLKNEFMTKPLPTLTPEGLSRGCLSESPERAGAAPWFGFTREEREALRHFAATDRSSLLRGTATEFTQRQLTNLRCAECHGKFDGFPSQEALLGKLRPEWATRFLQGAIPDRPRPWLTARMPAFRAQAEGLARGMAMLAGFPPSSAKEPEVDLEKAKIGQALVSAEGGLSCIACHAVGKVKATQVFENAGINLAQTGGRLVKPYFERWLRNPLAVDPVSKMPVFFDEELRSVLTDVYGGDGAKQIEAIWQYIRLGDKMPPPPGTQPEP